jgi:hypothetical protein
MQGGHELGEVVKHGKVRRDVEESPLSARCGLP